MLKSLYRKLLPPSLRRSPAIWRLKSALLGHDRIYSAAYYRGQQEGSARSAAVIAESIVAEFDPETVIDVGCGTGEILRRLAERGKPGFGLELSAAAIAICEERNLDVRRFDLERDEADPGWRFDLAVSLEVAEHLPPKAAARYVDLLAAVAPTIVFSAAPPGQFGVDHVHLRPPAYWIGKFEERGFELLEELTKAWKSRWKQTSQVRSHYHQNLLIFRRCSDLKTS